ncbi:SEC14 cytosolic factor-like [Wolffia australiana]
MGPGQREAINQFRALISEVDEELQRTFWNVHQGYPDETLIRFLQARNWNVQAAHEMLVNCLKWRVENEIDNILAKPITPADLYRALRETQLVGLSGYSKKGQPVFAIGVGMSTFDRASVHYYLQSHIQINEYRDRVVFPAATKKRGTYVGKCLKVLDMTGLKISALSQVKLLTMISTVDDLNYPEKTETYYVVNAPYVFSACWRVVKPLLQERTRRKIQVLQGCGKDELLKVMDYSSLPHFCQREGSIGAKSCYSFDHHFHQQLYAYIREEFTKANPVGPISAGSFHVDVPEGECEKTIESELQKLGLQKGVNRCVQGIRVCDQR